MVNGMGGVFGKRGAGGDGCFNFELTIVGVRAQSIRSIMPIICGFSKIVFATRLADEWVRGPDRPPTQSAIVHDDGDRIFSLAGR